MALTLSIDWRTKIDRMIIAHRNTVLRQKRRKSQEKRNSDFWSGDKLTGEQLETTNWNVQWIRVPTIAHTKREKDDGVGAWEQVPLLTVKHTNSHDRKSALTIIIASCVYEIYAPLIEIIVRIVKVININWSSLLPIERQQFQIQLMGTKWSERALHCNFI